MLDHVSLGVNDLDRSRRFYDAALRPLGLVRIVDFGRGSDYGAAPGFLGVEFSITREVDVRAPAAGAHLCFRAPSRGAVQDFHLAALAAGGQGQSDDHQRQILVVYSVRRDAQIVTVGERNLPRILEDGLGGRLV